MEYVMQNGLLLPSNGVGQIRLPSPNDLLKKIGKMLAGFVPDEGEALISDLVWKRDQTDRAADLELGLFTNVSPGETITEATITEPTGTGYARITLTDANWTGSADNRAYAQQTFTGGTGGWSGSVQGYFICTTGATKRLLCLEVDPNGPYTIAENDTYKITPSNTVA